MPLSAKDIAVRVAPSEDAVQSVFERVRHWTREGLLTPVGEENPGTGRKREYHDTDISKARLLNALADLGVNLGTLKRIEDFVFKQLAEQNIKDWAPAGMDFMLFVEGPRWAPDKFRVVGVASSDGETVLIPRGAVFAVNLSRLLAG